MTRERVYYSIDRDNGIALHDSEEDARAAVQKSAKSWPEADYRGL